MRVWLVAVALAVGCGGATSGETTATTSSSETTITTTTTATAAPGGAEGRVIDGCWTPPGYADPPTACAVDADCLADTLPDPASPCCNDPTTLRPSARRYRDAVQAWRAERCASVSCPPPPAPMLPPECAFTTRCVEGACRDSC